MQGSNVSEQPQSSLPTVELEVLAPSKLAPPPVDRFAVSQFTTYRWSMAQDIEGLRSSDVSAIGVWRTKLDSDVTLKQTAQTIRDAKLQVSSLSYAGGFTGASGMSFDDAIDDALVAVAEARALDASCLVLSTGPRGGHTRNHAMRIAAEGIKIVADAAAIADVQIAVQPMNEVYADEWTFLNNLDSALHLLDLCNHPNVGLSFGTMHLGTEPGIEERIEEIADRVSLVRLGNRLPKVESEADMRLMASGVVPVDKLVAAFLDTGYRGFFEVDVWSERMWRGQYEELLDYCLRQYIDMFE